jgi:hypothetical protein
MNFLGVSLYRGAPQLSQNVASTRQIKVNYVTRFFFRSQVVWVAERA